MNILVMSLCGDGYSIALALADEGNNVTFWAKKPRYRVIGLGKDNPRIVHDYHIPAHKADLIIFDMTEMGGLADMFKKQGKVVWAGSSVADKAELDRGYGMEIMKQYTDIDIPEFKQFGNIAAAIKYAKTNMDKTFAFKPDSHDEWSYVAYESNISLIEHMSQVADKNNGCILQTVIDDPDMVCIEIEGWANGRHFLEPFNLTLEEKRLMNDNLGPQTGCASNIIWMIENDDCKFSNYLKQLEPFVKESNYHGPVALNMMVTKDKVWFAEFTMRMGYAATPTQLQMIRGETGETIYRAAKGEDFELPFPMKEYAASTTIFIPPYPSNDTKRLDRIQKNLPRIINVTDDVYDNVWPYDCRWDNEGRLVSAGTNGLVGYINTTGKTIESAADKGYEVIDKITKGMNDEIGYRTDTGCDAPKQIETLQKWGYL